MIPRVREDSEVLIKFTQINGSRAGFYHGFFTIIFFVYPADAQKNSSIFWMSLRQKIEGLAVHDPIERIKRQRT